MIHSSPSSITVGLRGTWTFILSNYGDNPQQFEVRGDWVTETITVPTSKVALITLERAFAIVGSNEVSLRITNKQTGEQRTLTEDVVVTPQVP